MFIITNREVHPTKTGLAALGPKPNPQGPNELRLAEAERKAGKWNINILEDHIKDKKLIEEYDLQPQAQDEDGKPVIFASQYVAKNVSRRLEDLDRNLVFFVHGYNNNVEDVLNRAQGFENAYGVEVVAFSWPANGGGFIGGTTDYLSDKRDAQASVGALSRALHKVSDYLDAFNAQRIKDIETQATLRFPDNEEKWNQFFTRTAEKGCPFTVSLVLHSMGNYLFKHVLQSSAQRVDRLTFDNVVLVAADTNNDGHAAWANLIRCRKRVYITINEDDGALRASRMKAGEEQRARLGHYPFNLDCERAVYVDFTNVPHVDDSHAYFEGKPLQNTKVKNFFRAALNGERAEEKLPYEAARRLYCCR